MMNIRRVLPLYLAIAAGLGMGVGYMIAVQATADAAQQRQAGNTTNAGTTASPASHPPGHAPSRTSARYADTSSASGERRAGPPSADDVGQMLRDLQTLAYGDRRSFAQKLDDLLAEHPGQDGIAVASKGLFDLVDNRDVLPDRSLQSMYAEQKDPELRRVLAQVASMRGDNSLIERYIAEAGSGLRSADAAARQKALVQLAKTRYAGAADMATPLLRDEDAGVALDALLALRATGNQRHVRFVEDLVGHPDESVRWLALDVIAQLQVLSDLARTNIVGNELAAELPPVPASGIPPGCGPASG